MKPRLWMLLCVAASAGVVIRYSQTRDVVASERTFRTVEETAAEGRRVGMTVVQVGASRGLIRRPTEGHRWLLFWSGDSATYFRHAVDVIERLSLPAHVGVLIVAPPGYDSEGTPSPELVAREAIAAREWLRVKEGAGPIVAASFSMGCYSVYEAAREHVVGAVMVGASEDLKVSGAGPSWLRTSELYTRAASPPPVTGLIIQAALDRFEPLESDILLKWWPGLRRVMVPGLGHEELRLAPQTLAAMRESITAMLGTSSSPSQSVVPAATPVPAAP